ncbi:MAG TPA: helix-turn-helix domain-containing protein [Actinomycetes bacterium]|jgi:DNA-binding HxlR family transcriptional regulator|nr:helix-turn-helix domain-containing protein [Actinomycetes bacterium]
MSETRQPPAAAEHPGSPLHEAVVRVGDRWTLLVVEALLAGPRRFNDLLGELPGIASNVLSQRLKTLEGWGLVVGQPYSQHPPRLAYQLSAAGRELAGALRLLAQWGAQRSGDGEALQHLRCGTQLEARWYCPTCARVVDDDEAGELRFV